MAVFLNVIFTILCGTAVCGAVISVISGLILLIWVDSKCVTDSFEISKKPLLGLIKPRLVSDEEMKIIRKMKKEFASLMIFVSFVVAFLFMVVVIVFA